MKNKLIIAAVSFVAVLGLASMAPDFAAASPADAIQGGVNQVGGGGDDDLGGRIEDIINLLLFLLGAVAVVMIVIGGIRYATSNGESSAITSAKNTILYAVIGLVVAILAYAIVNFVINAFD